MIATIKVKADTKMLLNNIKIIERETYDDVIQRLIQHFAEDQLELNSKTRKVILERVKKINEGEEISDKFKEEVREILADGFLEQSSIKRIIADKSNNQFSLKIPKDLATKSLLTESSKFKIVFKPSQKTLEELKKSKLVIYFQE